MIQTNPKKYANKQYIMHTTDERGAYTDAIPRSSHKKTPKKKFASTAPKRNAAALVNALTRRD